MENQVVCSCCYKPLPTALEQYGERDYILCFDCFALGLRFKWQHRLIERDNGERVIYLEDDELVLMRPFEWELPVFHHKERVEVTRYEKPILTTLASITKRRTTARKPRKKRVALQQRL